MAGDLDVIGKIVNYRYEVLEKIGDGPLFSVYKSRDKVLNRLVALKSPTKDLQGAPGLNQALVTAYRGVMGLAHPNIAKVFDADCVDGECFVACEFARGINVKERVRRAGPISAPLAVDIMIPVLTALEYAHSTGIVHGDLAAQDIIVSPDSEVKVTDFGLAGVLAEHPDVADKYVMRSVHYEAPETIAGASPTIASDIYSAGVILYEMLTGQLPYDGATSVAVAMKKAKDAPVNPRVINTAVPKSLSDIAMRAIEPAPEDRYPSASDMLAELRSVSHALRTGAPAGPVDIYSSSARVARTADEVAADSPEPSFWPQFRLMFLLFIVVCVVVGSVAYVYVAQKQKKTVIVPNFVGMTMEVAQQAADAVGLKLEQGPSQASDAVPEGLICASTPPAGTLTTPDKAVVVNLSSGASVTLVPYVVGKSEPDAYQAIKDADFKVGEIKQENSDKFAVNSVISQSPPGGTSRPPGIAIDLVVSLGPKPVEETAPPAVPNPTDATQQREFTVNVQVPADADGPQDVRVEMTDDNVTDKVIYQGIRDPGANFDVKVKGFGSSIDVKTYIGGVQTNDTVY